MNAIILASMITIAALAACGGKAQSVTPPTPIPITPATSCTIGDIVISGPAVIGCGPTSTATPTH